MAATAYETAFMMTVPPPVIAANRALLMALIATNFFGQNTPAIMATEAQYMEMWAQDAAAMYGYAVWHHTAESPFSLGAIVFVAMTCSCLLSGITGVMVPLTLERLGFDAATASSIFLTTATDVASMGFLLALATVWLG